MILITACCRRAGEGGVEGEEGEEGEEEQEPAAACNPITLNTITHFINLVFLSILFNSTSNACKLVFHLADPLPVPKSRAC